MPKTETTNEQRLWEKFFGDYYDYVVSLKSPRDAGYETGCSLEYLYQMFKDRSNEE